MTAETRFTIFDRRGGRALVELTGTVQDVKKFLNQGNPSGVTVNGATAHDGRGHRFHLIREEIE